jgi:hypothetical protein
VAWSCKAGGTLFIPSGPQGDHLFVILNDPANFVGHPPGCCVLVNFSKIPTGPAPYDKTVVVQAGTHKFIKHPSYIVYRHPRLDRVVDLVKRVEAFQFSPQDPVANDLLQKLIAGLYESSQTPGYIKEIKLG